MGRIRTSYNSREKATRSGAFRRFVVFLCDPAKPKFQELSWRKIAVALSDLASLRHPEWHIAPERAARSSHLDDASTRTLRYACLDFGIGNNAEPRGGAVKGDARRVRKIVSKHDDLRSHVAQVRLYFREWAQPHR